MASPTAARPARRPRTTWLLNRWPTALAIGMSAPGFLGGAGSDGSDGSDGSVESLGNVLLILPLGYLILAKLQRRQATWPVVVIAIAAVVALRATDVIAPSAVLTTAALIVLVWGAVDGQLQRPGTFRVQALGLVGFGALAFGGLAVLATAPDLGRYLVAAGWFLHGVWDLVYLKLDKVVARSFAEWCAVIDVLIAAQLVFML